MWLNSNVKKLFACGKLFILIVCVGCMSGCSVFGTYNPATGRNEFIAISTPEEVNMGQQIHQSLEKQYQFSTDQAKLDRLENISQRIAQVSDRQDYQYEFYLIEKDEYNAFTIPGGFVYIYTGLFDKLTDDQVASVIAHEIGHCAAKHTIKKFQAAMGYNLVGRLVLSQVDGGTSQQIASLSAGVLSNVIFSAYGRKDEYEADRLGVKYMHLAGYDMQGSVQALEFLLKESKGPDVPLILRSHPHLEDRIDAIKLEIYKVKTQFALIAPFGVFNTGLVQLTSTE